MRALAGVDKGPDYVFFKKGTYARAQNESRRWVSYGSLRLNLSGRGMERGTIAPTYSVDIAGRRELRSRVAAG